MPLHHGKPVGLRRRLTGGKRKSLFENVELAAGYRPNPHAGSVRHHGSAAILAAGSRSFPAPCSVFLNFQTRFKRRFFNGMDSVPWGSGQAF